MYIRRALVPYHFNQLLDIIPGRSGEWEQVVAKTLSAKLAMVNALNPDLVVSGDCMSAIGAHRKGLTLVWLDAHGDFHTNTTTESGSLGGMPLAMLAGCGCPRLMQACGQSPVANIYHFGGSEFDDGEQELMLENGLFVSDILTDSIEFPTPLHLHIDTDVISSNQLPSAFHPAPNGINMNTLFEWLNKLLPQTQVLSIKTYDPRKDLGGVGQKVVLEIIRRYEACRTRV